jgi:hypothetical protein
MRNYTSSVPASRSMENIEKLLVDLNCISISRYYEDKEICGFFFQLSINNNVYAFKLPAKVDLVYKQLFKGRNPKNDNQRIEWRKQAARTAWKTLHELIQIQTDLILLEQLKPFEAFLPFAFDGQMTLAERVESGSVKLLESAKDNDNKIIELTEYTEVK